MKTVKRVVILITCFVVLLSSFSLGVSAEFDFYSDYEFDFDTQRYYDPYSGLETVYDEAHEYYYSPSKPLEYEPFSLYMSSTVNFPKFDVTKLPWLEMPTYIQDILYCEPQGNISSVDIGSGTYKVPFVLCIVSSDEVHVIAGYNLSIGTYYKTKTALDNNDPSAVYIVTRTSSDYIYRHAAAYHAYYKTSDYSLKQAWSQFEPTAVGDNFARYAQMRFPDSSVVRDYYCYGFNGFGPGMTSLTQRIYKEDDDSFPQYRFYGDPVVGFTSGKFVYCQGLFTNGFFAFTPPTAEQQQASTSKGIWEALKELPSKIAESIKGFFTSLGDRISLFFISLRNYLLYFQEDKPVHVNPFENLMNNIIEFFDDKISSYNEFNATLNNSLDEIITYVSSGSSLINNFLKSSSILSAFIVFFVAFFIVRKVVGR